MTGFRHQALTTEFSGRQRKHGLDGVPRAGPGIGSKARRQVIVEAASSAWAGIGLASSQPLRRKQATGQHPNHAPRGPDVVDRPAARRRVHARPPATTGQPSKQASGTTKMDADEANTPLQTPAPTYGAVPEAAP